MQILSLLGIGKTLTKIVAALYRSIASIYTDMTELVNTFTQGQFADTLNKVVGNVYTLVGVFMLFRIGVSLLNYLVDPSKLDDKKVGGGQLVTHILISIVLLLSLKFVFVWTNELQGHLLESGGILDNIIKTGNAEVSKLNNISLADNTEVSVASKKYLADESVEQRCENVSSDVIKTLQKFINESCPHSSITISESNISSRLADYAQRDNIVGGNKILEYMDVYLKLDNGGTKKITSLKEKGTINYATKTYEYKCLMSAIGGSSRAEDIEVTSQSKFIVDYYCTPKTIDTIEQNTYNYINSQYDLPNVSADGLNFSIITLSAFVSPSNELNETFLTKYEGDYSSDWWAEKIEDEVSEGKVYSMDWLMAIICGLAIIVVLLAIMIEVVVRNLKLVILQAIAPIPIVSYMNPNDKMLGNWVKQYVGVYFSLFLQLLAITLIPKLMMSLLQSITGGFILKIIIIAGCLLFTKEAPKFISKLLGLENMSGSFGDAFKMVKTGLGIGAKGVAAVGTMGALAAYGASGKRIWESGKAIMGSKGAISTIKNVHGASKTAKQERIQGKGPWWQKDYSEANKSAATAYSNLDKAMDGAMFSSNKAIEQIQKFYDTGTVEDKLKNYKVFGVSDKEWAKTGGDVEKQLQLIDKTWGDRKNNERAKIFVQAIRNVQNGTASAFDQNIVSLARNLEVAESGTEVGATKFSEIVNINNEEQAVEAAAAALKTAKEHSKSGYKSSSKGYSAGSSNTTATISTSTRSTVSSPMGDNNEIYLQSQNLNQINNGSSTNSTNEADHYEEHNEFEQYNNYDDDE